MQRGDILTDGQGASWVVDEPLGRGLWGTSWALKGEDGTLAVAKVPHVAADFPDADEPRRLAEVCARAAEDVRAELEAGRFPCLPRLLGVLELSDGRQALITPRYGASLEARLGGGLPLSDAIDLVVRILHQLATSTAGGVVHGNLRPTNVFLDEGRPVLADPLVDTLHADRSELARACRHRTRYLPPEAGRAPAGTWDTWSACLALYRAAALAGEDDDPSRGRRLDLPHEGLGRVALAGVKDAAADRLRAEHVNQRFAARATSRLGAILNRGLSADAEPSPPYRFERARDLLDRLVEVDELVHPTVSAVSRVMLGSAARDGVFAGGDDVVFSVNVGASAGVEAHEDIACGVRLVDLDASGDGRVRVEGARFKVDRYPSGKWRFEFALPDVPPGRYEVSVGFQVKGNDGPAEDATGTFEVRPGPGYVPPTRDEPTEARTIPLPARAPAPETAPRPPAARPSPPRPIRPADDYEPPPAEPVAPPPPPAQAPALRDVPPPVAPAPEPPKPTIRLAPPPTPIDAPTSPPSHATDWTSPDPSSPGHDDGPISFGNLTVPGPASTPSQPGPAAGGAFDPLLSDYPPPPARGTELPTIDLGDRGAGASALDRVRQRVTAWFQDDPWSAVSAIAAGGFVVIVLGLALLRSC